MLRRTTARVANNEVPKEITLKTQDKPNLSNTYLSVQKLGCYGQKSFIVLLVGLSVVQESLWFCCGRNDDDVENMMNQIQCKCFENGRFLEEPRTPCPRY